MATYLCVTAKLLSELVSGVPFLLLSVCITVLTSSFTLWMACNISVNSDANDLNYTLNVWISET